MHRPNPIQMLSMMVMAFMLGAFLYVIIFRPALITAAQEDATPTPVDAPPILESRIAFVSDRDGNPEIYTMKPDGSDVVRLTYNDALDWEPRWSPDGTRIAWLSEQDGQRDLYVMNADGSNPVRISETPEYEISLEWSPDNVSLAYTDVDSQTGAESVYLYSPDWSAHPYFVGDGRDIAWTSVDGDDVYLTYIDGNNPQQMVAIITGPDLLRGSGLFVDDETLLPAFTDWQPYSYVLAFVATGSDSTEERIYWTDGVFDESVPVERLTEPGNYTGVKWSPFGTYLAFAKWRDDLPELSVDLYVMDMVKRSEPILLTTIVKPMGFDWSPDEQRIVYKSTDADDIGFIGWVGLDGSSGILTDNTSMSIMPDWSPYLNTAPETSTPEPTPIVPTEEILPSATPIEPTPTLVPSSTPMPQTHSHYLNLLAVYPDGRVREAVLFDPYEADSTGESERVTVIAGYSYSTEDILNIGSFGGTEVEREIRDIYPQYPCSDGAVSYAHVKLTLSREKNGAPYGIDTMATNSPYLYDYGFSDELPDEYTHEFTYIPDMVENIDQVLTAVAFPEGTVLTFNKYSTTPYQEINLGGWTIYYFDHTDDYPCADGSTFRFRPGDFTPEDLDVFEVDALR